MAVDARRVAIVALALLAGAIVGGIVVSEGAPFAGVSGGPIVVRVLNEGTNAAQFSLSASLIETGRAEGLSGTLGGGAREEMDLGTVEGQVSLRLRVEWTFGARTGSAERGALADAANCGRGETLVVTMPFRVEQGATFGTTQRTCV